MLEETHLSPAFFPRFLSLADGYFVSVRNFALGQLVFRFHPDGELIDSDTLSIGETYYSYLVNGEPRLVSQQGLFTGTGWRIRTVLHEFDTQGVYADSLVLREEDLNAGESAAGHAFHYDGSVLTCIAASVRPGATLNTFRVWMTIYDGSSTTEIDPWDPGPLPQRSYVTSWEVLRTTDARYVLAMFVRGEANMAIWFLGLESDGSFNSNLHLQSVASDHLLNGMILKEHNGSLLYAFTEVTTDGSFGGGAQVAAFPLTILLNSRKQRPELPSSLTLSAFPNPFNASSTISFSLPERSSIALKVFDLLGREVATLAEGMYTSGTHQRFWSASSAASGKYFCRLTTQDDSRVIPLILMK